jgi:hypothetical protein
MNSSEESLSWFGQLELWLDRLVRCGEVLVVLLLTALLLGGIVYQTIWILWASSDCREVRFAQSLKTINDNWKVGLIILIPLFYRGIRAFLERVEEFAGMKAPVKKSTPTGPQGE